MCLTTPVKIKKLKGVEAELADGRIINVAMAGRVKTGDWVLANANLGLSRISAKEAKEISNLLK
jgi:hydrogenase maturation factor